MSVEPCDWCQYSDFLNAYYNDILKGYDFVVGDPEDFPKTDDPNKYVAGLIIPELKKIGLRKDLTGQYMHVPFKRKVNYKDMDIMIMGIAPIHMPEFVAAHECWHGKRYNNNGSQDENEIDRLAIDYCIDFYVKNKLESFGKQTMGYAGGALNTLKNYTGKKSPKDPIGKMKDYLA
ncbi:MAG: hypothetical protein V1678_05560 [Candidatus Aenigmatarchaeota archaeon]